MLKQSFLLSLLSSIAIGSGLDLQGDLSATVLQTTLARELVETWLPKETKLISQANEVKVFFFIGEQRNLKLGIPLAFGKHYTEMIAVIPEVSYLGKEYIYFPKLYLDNQKAVSTGVAVYGFPKVLAEMESTKSLYRIADLTSGEEFFHADLEINEGKEIAITHASLVPILNLLSKPMLLVKNDKISCSAFVLDPSTARFYPAKTNAKISTGFMPEMGNYETNSESLETTSTGSFYFQAHWRVPPSSSCSK